MPHFFMKLTPPRPTFPSDITAEENAVMVKHAEYLQGLFQQGKLLAYGPVFDPAGAFGMVVFEVADAAEAEALMSADPSAVAGLMTVSIFPMRITGAQASHAS